MGAGQGRVRGGPGGGGALILLHMDPPLSSTRPGPAENAEIGHKVTSHFSRVQSTLSSVQAGVVVVEDIGDSKECEERGFY